MEKHHGGLDKRLLLILDFEQEYSTYLGVIDTFVRSYADKYYELLLYVTDAPKQRFDVSKKIWERRDLLIIEDEKSRLGVGNYLLGQTKVLCGLSDQQSMHLTCMRICW